MTTQIIYGRDPGDEDPAEAPAVSNDRSAADERRAVDERRIEALALDLRRTRFLPLTHEINARWCDLYELLRKTYPEKSSDRVDRMARDLVWGCR